MEEIIDVSIDECKSWLKELYSAADRVKGKSPDQYRKIALLAGLLEDLVETLESGMLEESEMSSDN